MVDKRYIQIGSIAGIILVLLVLVPRLYVSDYRAILNENPDYDLFLLPFNETDKIELISRSHTKLHEFFRWRYQDGKAKYYIGSDLIDTSYWQVFEGSKGIFFNKKSPLTYELIGEDAAIVTMVIDYYYDSYYTRPAGKMTRIIEVYPRLNKETILWVPVNNSVRYNLRWIHETDDRYWSQSLRGLDHIDLEKHVISWEDSFEKVSTGYKYNNGKVRINYKSAYGYQEIDPSVIIGQYQLTYDIDESKGIPYTKFCNDDCTLPFSLTVNKDVTVPLQQITKAYAHGNAACILSDGLKIWDNGWQEVDSALDFVTDTPRYFYMYGTKDPSLFGECDIDAVPGFLGQDLEEMAFWYDIEYLQEDIAGIKYTPFCIKECDLPFKFRVNTSVNLTRNTDINQSFLDSSSCMTDYTWQWLEVGWELSNYTYYKNTCALYNFTNGTHNPHTNCSGSGWYNVTNNVTTYDWIDADFDYKELEQDRWYYLNLHGYKTGEKCDVDAIPIIFEESFSTLAWWNSSYDYKYNLTPNMTGRLSEVFVVNISTISGDTDCLSIVVNDTIVREWEYYHDGGVYETQLIRFIADADDNNTLYTRSSCNADGNSTIFIYYDGFNNPSSNEWQIGVDAGSSLGYWYNSTHNVMQVNESADASTNTFASLNLDALGISDLFDATDVSFAFVYDIEIDGGAATSTALVAEWANNNASSERINSGNQTNNQTGGFLRWHGTDANKRDWFIWAEAFAGVEIAQFDWRDNNFYFQNYTYSTGKTSATIFDFKNEVAAATGSQTGTANAPRLRNYFVFSDTQHSGSIAHRGYIDDLYLWDDNDRKMFLYNDTNNFTIEDEESTITFSVEMTNITPDPGYTDSTFQVNVTTNGSGLINMTSYWYCDDEEITLIKFINEEDSLTRVNFTPGNLCNQTSVLSTNATINQSGTVAETANNSNLTIINRFPTGTLTDMVPDPGYTDSTYEVNTTPFDEDNDNVTIQFIWRCNEFNVFLDNVSSTANASNRTSTFTPGILCNATHNLSVFVRYNDSYNLSWSRNTSVNISKALMVLVEENITPLNVSGAVMGDFNSSYIRQIETVTINFSLEITGGDYDTWQLNYTADGPAACALSNTQSDVCYNYTNTVYKWINVRKNDTTTFIRVGSVGDQIILTKTNNGTHELFSFNIDEHYNPNVAKHYPMNFSNIKWQSGTGQRIRSGNQIRVNLTKFNITVNASEYKLDFRVNFSPTTPTEPLHGYLCNSTHAGGDPSINPGCFLVASRTPNQINQSGFRFRGIFTNNSIRNISDIGYAVIESDQVSGRYYSLRTVKQNDTTQLQKWEYSTNNGNSYNNLDDDYESELNINWFYLDSPDPTYFRYNFRVNASDGAEVNVSGDYYWKEGLINFVPLIDIITPADNVSVKNPISEYINWTTSDANMDLLLINISLLNSDFSLNKTLLTKGGDSGTYTWTDSLEPGLYHIVVEVYENNSVHRYVENDTHEFTVLNSAPNVSEVRINSTSLSVVEDLVGWCNGTDIDQGALVSYNLSWFKNGESFRNFSEDSGNINPPDKSGDGPTGAFESGSPSSNAFDGDWETNAVADSGNSPAYLHWNYSAGDNVPEDWNFTFKYEWVGTANIAINIWNYTSASWDVISSSAVNEFGCQLSAGIATAECVGMGLTDFGFNETHELWLRAYVYSDNPSNKGSIYEANMTYTGAFYYTEGVEQNLDNISSSDLTIGDSWNFTCRVFDGTDYSARFNYTVTIRNIAPVVEYVIFNQSDFAHPEDVTCSSLVTDLEEPNFNVTVDWYVDEVFTWQENFTETDNGTIVNATLHSDNYTSLQTVNCTYTINDTYNLSIDSNITTIIGAIPSVSVRNITPDPAYTNSSIQLNFTVFDPDDGDVVDLIVNWSCAGDVFDTQTYLGLANATNITSDLVINQQCNKTQEIEVIGYVNDSFRQRTNSSSIILSNLAPEIRIANITSDSFTSSDALEGWCNGTDFDLPDDRLNYTWIWYEDGIAIEVGSSSEDYLASELVNVDNLSIFNAGSYYNFSCLVNDSDYATSDYLNSSGVYVQNTPASIAYVQLNSTVFLSNETIGCSVFFTDIDVGQTFDVNFSWMVEQTPIWNRTYSGIENGTIVNDSLAPGNYTGHDIVNCTVLVDDTFDSVTDFNFTTLIGVQPNVTLWNISGIFTDDTFIVNATINDEDFDNVFVNISWLCDDVVINHSLEGPFSSNVEKTYSYTPGNLCNKTQELTAHAYVNDTYGLNTTYNISVTIVNSPPVIDVVRINSTTNATTENLVGICNASDVDSDNVTYNFTWYKNSVQDRNGTTGINFSVGISVLLSNITSSELNVSDVWILECFADDEGNFSAKVNSTNVTILNSPSTLDGPFFNATSYFTNEGINCSGIVYDVDIYQELNVTLRFEVDNVFVYEENFTVTDSTGVNSILGSDNYSKNQVVNCTILINDSFGLVSEFNFTVINNTPPTSTGATLYGDTLGIRPDSNLTCSLSGIYDEDDDTTHHIYSWRNLNEQAYGENESLYAFYFPFEEYSNDSVTIDYANWLNDSFDNDGVVNGAIWGFEYGVNFTSGNRSGGYYFQNASITVVSSIDFDTTYDFDNSTNFTISVWVNASILSGRQGLVTRDVYGLYLEDNKPVCYANPVMVSGPVIPDDYTYLVCEIEWGGNLTLYVNGTLVNSTSFVRLILNESLGNHSGWVNV